MRYLHALSCAALAAGLLACEEEPPPAGALPGPGAPPVAAGAGGQPDPGSPDAGGQPGGGGEPGAGGAPGADGGPAEIVCDDPGRVTLRRLNNTEYDRTVADLVGDTTQPARAFPQDDIGYGFDNIGDVLSVTPVHLEGYEAAAERLVAAAIKVPTPAGDLDFEAEEVGSETGAMVRGEFWNLWSNGEIVTAVDLPETGTYILKARAAGQQAGPDPAQMAILFDGQAVATVDVANGQDAFAWFEHTLHAEAGAHSFGVAFLNDYYAPDDPDPAQRDRNLIVDVLRVSGPYDVVAAPDEVRQRIMVCEPAGDDDTDCAREVVAGFAAKAWRRPVEAAEVDRLMGLVQLAQGEGDSVHVGLALALQATLLSPHFVFKVELDAEPEDLTPHRLSEHELATRLSYFLWSTMPDAALRAAADEGRLSDPVELERQVRRMLADPKAENLVDDFAAQWLYVRAMDDHHPDYNDFPDFDDDLRAAMKTETRLFFRDALFADRPLSALMRAEHTFADARLAAHYGFDWAAGEAVEGLPEGWRRFALDGTERSGLLSLGSVLTVTSFPTRTSPVRRGKWVLEQLLCDEPPPPPPGVEADLGDVDANASLRERLAQHRENPMCATCHDRMDPIGLGMDTFDGVGTFRTHTADGEIDASGELPDGTLFDGPTELAALLADDARLGRCFTEKLSIYALGRGADAAYDRCNLYQLDTALAADEHRLMTAIVHLTQADSFTHRRGELPPDPEDEDDAAEGEE